MFFSNRRLLVSLGVGLLAGGIAVLAFQFCVQSRNVTLALGPPQPLKDADRSPSSDGKTPQDDVGDGDDDQDQRESCAE